MADHPHSSAPSQLSPTDYARSKIIADAVTFDDVLLLPRASGITPSDADTSTRLTRNIRINIPLLSAPMDTVTESALAIALAQEGGIGIIHRNMPVEAQAREVEKVKRTANGVIPDPVTVGPDDTVADARRLMSRFNVSGFPVTADGSAGLRTKGKVLGIITRRDLKFIENDQTPVREVMTSKDLVTAPPGTTLEQAAKILNRNKVQKLILVDGAGSLAGLVTMRDIERQQQFPRACLDPHGRLRCGGAGGGVQFDPRGGRIGAGGGGVVVGQGARAPGEGRR
ncbi:MAG: IMP dehydrogenase, partial [Phycisphaerales bacterium]|nr:IMP dehydrogenase [Phycisphaerales bacterium]